MVGVFGFSVAVEKIMIDAQRNPGSYGITHDPVQKAYYLPPYKVLANNFIGHCVFLFL